MVSVSSYILSMGIYVAILFAFIAWMRRSLNASLWFWVLSLLAIPVMYFFGGVEGWFRWSKTFSVVVPLIIVGCARISIFKNKQGKFWRLFDKKWILFFTFFILALNILEATMKDFEAGYWANGIAGVALIITIPLPIKFWTIERKERGDLLIFTTLAWNLLYTTWNAAFVYGESPDYFAASLCIIMVAEIYPFIKGKQEYWVMARIYTLGLHLLIRGCFPMLFLRYMDATPWHNETFLFWWGIVNAAFGVVYTVWYIIAMAKGKYTSDLVEQYGTQTQFDRA